MLRLCNACTIGLKVNSLNPNVPRCNRTLVGSTSETDAIGSQRSDFRRMVRLVRWAMRSERMQGHEWGAYVVLACSSVTEHGMAYGMRILGSRSPRRSRRWGEPTTWRRGTGGRHLKGKGCEMHKNLNREDVVNWKAD